VEPALHTATLQEQAFGFLRDPARRAGWRDFYDVALAAPPVFLGNREWLIAGRDEVLAAMRDEGAELTALYPATRSPALNELFLGMLPFESGPRHRQLRALVSAEVTRAAPRLREAVAALLERQLFPAVFAPEGCDVLGTLGVQVPEAVSCLLLDVARADWPMVGDWARRLYAQLGRYDQSASELAALDGLHAAFRDYVLRRRTQPPGETHGGIGTALIAAWQAGTLGDEELISYFALFLLTGLDTLTHGIGNALWFLGNRPDIFATLRADPERAERAFVETVRLWGPIRLCIRHLQRAVQLDAVTLPEQALTFLLVHAANRDPKRLAQPDEFLWQRPRTEDLAFGVGPHGCLGTAIGRLVGRTLFQTLAGRCRSLRATPGLDSATFIPSLQILGVENVRLFAEPDG